MPKSSVKEIVSKIGVETHVHEVMPRRAKRTFAAKDKLRIINEVDSCQETGGVGKILRREGIYSSYLSDWRRELNLRGSMGMSDRKPGRKPEDKKEVEILELKRRNAVLERNLDVTRKLIELQKKTCELLGLALPDTSEFS